MDASDFKKTIRVNYLIDREFQLKFLLHYFLIIVFGVAVTVVFLYWVNKTKYDNGVVFKLRQDPVKIYQKGFDYENGIEKEKFVEREIFLPDYDHKLDMFQIQFTGIMLLAGLFLILITVFTLFNSHRMAGPIYNIKNSLRKLINGDRVKKISLREGDEFQELADLINQLIEKRVK